MAWTDVETLKRLEMDSCLAEELHSSVARADFLGANTDDAGCHREREEDERERDGHAG